MLVLLSLVLLIFLLRITPFITLIIHSLVILVIYILYRFRVRVWMVIIAVKTIIV